MHSHDKTLLSKLGFADPDKKDPRHDYACQYLAQPDVGRRLYQALAEADGHTWLSRMGMGKPEFEFHLTKGEGQYKTTIGFIDLILKPIVGYPCEAKLPVPCPVVSDREVSDAQYGSAGRQPNTKYAHKGYKEVLTALEHEKQEAWRQQVQQRSASKVIFKTVFTSLVEVKVKPTPIGDVLRQMKLYEEYVKMLKKDSPFLSPRAQPFDDLTNTQLKIEGLCCSYNRCGFECDAQKWSRLCSVVDDRFQKLFQATRRIVATAYPLSEADIGTLMSEGIRHVQLGPSFDEYVKLREAEMKVTTEEPSSVVI